MIEIEKFHSRVSDLETLMQVKLGARGKTLAARFRHAGRGLPKRVRNAGRVITEAQHRAAHPKLARLQDAEALDAAFAEVVTHLKAIDPAERRKAQMLGHLGGLVFNLILLLVALLVFLHWQGLV